MKKIVMFALAALLVPSVALAKNPNHPNKGTPTNQSSKAKVMYVLKGLLYNYTAYTPASGTTQAVDGSIQIVVLHSNRHGKLLRSDPSSNPLYVNIAIGPKTKVKFKHGVTSFTNGDRGTVKIRASRFAFKGATTASDIQDAFSTPGVYAHMVRDWGPPKS